MHAGCLMEAAGFETVTGFAEAVFPEAPVAGLFCRLFFCLDRHQGPKVLTFPA
jgi:hypothetical protein